MNYLEDTIIDLIPQMKNGVGFFSKFNDPVWSEDFTNTSGLDIYFAMTYGQKHAAPFLTFYEGEDGTISNEDLTTLATIIYSMRANEWSKLYAALKAEYNPVENTDVTESIADTRAVNTTAGNTRTLNTQNTNAGTGSVNVSATGSGSSDNDVYGFDSATAVGASETSDSTQSSSATQTATNNTSTDTGTITDAGTGSESELYNRSYRKHGNIGTQTAADLIGGVIELWQWTFIIQVMEDINNFISLAVY